MLSERIHEIAQGIGQFLLTQNNGDYDKTWEHILRLQFTAITEENNVATITTCRPGILIGVRGKLIEDLEVFLKENCGVDGIKIVEDKDCLQDCIMPQKEYDDDMEWYKSYDLNDYDMDDHDDFYKHREENPEDTSLSDSDWFHERENNAQELAEMDKTWEAWETFDEAQREALQKKDAQYEKYE